jgi:hypothetical protein
VNLVERFVHAENFGPTIYGNANELYQDANPAYYEKHPNGSGYVPVPGDIVTFGGGAFGHVVVVTNVTSTIVDYVEQNSSPAGKGYLSLSGSTLAAYNRYLPVIGIIHARANTNPSGGESNGNSGLGPVPGQTDLDFIKTRNDGSGTLEVHWATASSGYQQRGGDFTSDFSPADAGNGSWQLFGSANGAPELGFVKTRSDGSGTVEVHWDTLQGGAYKRVGDSTSDFNPADAENGAWQIGPF